jgi:hypothetical protein
MHHCFENDRGIGMKKSVADSSTGPIGAVGCVFVFLDPGNLSNGEM